jgi:hypothetical protein
MAEARENPEKLWDLQTRGRSQTVRTSRRMVPEELSTAEAINMTKIKAALSLSQCTGE